MSRSAFRLSIGGRVPRDRGTSFRLYAGLLPYLAAKRWRVAVAVAWLSFLVLGVVVNAASWPAMGRIWFPPATWWPLMLWVTPAIATLGMAVTVLISARVNTFMEAYQMSAALVVLVLALVAGQVTGVLYLSVAVALAVGAVLWGVDALLIWLGIRHLRQETLLSRI